MIGSETPLERLLRHATMEPGMQPEFYRKLLDSVVLVPVQPAPDQRAGKIPPGSTLQVVTLLRTDGIGVIPLYTSAARVFEGSPQGERCVQMTVREIFESRPDMHFHVNPFSQFGREFVPFEVRSLIKHNAIAVPQRTSVPVDGSVSIRPFPDPPMALVDVLKVALARHLSVRAAYIAELSMPNKKVKRTCLIMIDFGTESDAEMVFRDVATLVTDYMTPTSPCVDVMSLPRDTSIYAEYFAQATPFYQIGLAGRFASPPSA
jgi:hypothetical protein